jgi:hypothetical protein
VLDFITIGFIVPFPAPVAIAKPSTIIIPTSPTMISIAVGDIELVPIVVPKGIFPKS